MARLWRDPRTGIWKLRRRIPQRYRGVANQKGATVKISTGTADRKAAEKALPEVLRQWGAMEAAWERTLNGGAPAPSSGRSLTNREAHALAGLWYRRLLDVRWLGCRRDAAPGVEVGDKDLFVCTVDCVSTGAGSMSAG